MESNLKKILKKYSDFKFYLLKNLDIRKSKIKVIWNQINSPRINKIVKIKNAKNKPKTNSFLNIDFSTFKLPKDLNFSILFRNSRKNKLKDKNSNLLKKQNKFNLKIKNIFKSNKLSKYSYKSLENSLSSRINLNYFDEKAEKYLKFKVSDVIKNFKTNKLTKNTNDLDLLVDLLGIYYVNNKVFFAHLKRKNKSNVIQDIVQINAPSDLIGDYKVEKIPEFKRMIEDITNVFELKNPPIILLLGSSFFTTRSFSDSELIVFSEEDPVISSKSPFLPDNTLVQYKRVNGDKNSSYHRVVYANKEVIDSWINTLSLIGSEIATVTCPAIHIIEKLTNKSDKEIFILCDVEDLVTSVYVLRNNCELFSKRLPFGSSVYITDKISLNNQFFSRLDSSVKSIVSENNLNFDDTIYINGVGIDKMLSLNNDIRDGFCRITRNQYELNLEKVKDFKKDESVLNSFSNILDTLIK